MINNGVGHVSISLLDLIYRKYCRARLADMQEHRLAG
jgi:hypothetical protein